MVATFYSSMADMANTEYGGYVDFDEGLRIMTEHAKALGYDAIILFLDELILWLASHLSDQNFIAKNIQTEKENKNKELLSRQKGSIREEYRGHTEKG